MPALLQRSFAEADRFAQLNVVQGQPFVLQPNPSNDADGDLTFGTLDTPRSRDLTLAQDIQNPANASLTLINLVKVNVRLSPDRGNAPTLILGAFVNRGSADLRAESAAMLDRDVIGFRPWSQQPLPLAPLALFADPSGADPKSWQYQVEVKKVVDQYRFDRVNNTFVVDKSGDGLFEFSAALALDASEKAQANVAMLFLGTSDAGGVAQQLETGITSSDLQDLGGALILQSADNRLTVPGTDLGPADTSQQAMKLFQSLDDLRKSARPVIWPLYCGLEALTNRPVLCGFVAARVVTVTPISPGQALKFVLQPTMLANSSAVTDANQRGVGGIAITNPYVCKVRLVE
jgi:hypothetical protein